MPFRVTDATNNDRLLSQISTQRQRLAVAQEQIATGKRINRPSDDPYGAAAVIEIRTSQTTIDQFRRNATVADSKLSVSDGALDSYEQALDRTRSLLSHGVSGFTSPDARKAVADEIDGLRQRILNIANLKSNGEYVFGGTRQDEPPFDPTTAIAAASPASPQLIQVELAAPPITVGVTAGLIFSTGDGTIFAALTAAATALRGTGDQVADQAAIDDSLRQLNDFVSQASVARTTIGKNLNAVEAATERHNTDYLSLETSAQGIETADFAKAATDLAEANRALEAVLETGAQAGRRSLLDFIG